MLSLDYIAGFFDGEGCITIIKYKRDSKHSGNKGYGLQTDITLVQKDINILNEIKETLEKFSIHGKIEKHTTNDVWLLRIRNFDNQQRFCDLFENRLILKKSQLLLLKEYIKVRMETRWNEHSYAPFTDKELGIYDQMKFLKSTPYESVIGGLV